MYIDGSWRGIRDPTDEEVGNINGETKKLGLGEFAEYTYMEALGESRNMWSFSWAKARETIWI